MTRYRSSNAIKAALGRAKCIIKAGSAQRHQSGILCHSVLAISGPESAASWATISSVAAGVVASGDLEMIAPALAVEDGDANKLFPAAETERIL